MIKGCISLGIGLLACCVGQSPIDGVAYRYSFGSMYLRNGFALVAVVIGVFALPEIINNAARLKEIPVVNKVEKKFFHMLDFQSIKKNIRTLLRSSVIGTVIGILPGLGGEFQHWYLMLLQKKLLKRRKNLEKAARKEFLLRRLRITRQLVER